MKSVASKSETSPASWVAYLDGSKRVIRPIPDVPASVAFHQASVPIPVGATTPSPVMTARSSDGADALTRRPASAPAAARR